MKIIIKKCVNLNETPLAQIKENKMKTKSSFVIILIVSFLFGQEEIIHISKTYPNGTPKEVTVYKRLNDELQSNNPFEIAGKFSYDSKGNWLRPKLTGTAKKTELIIIGSWSLDKNDDEYIKFTKDGTVEVYDGNDLKNTAVWFLTQMDDIIYINFIEGEDSPNNDNAVTIEILNKNRIIIDGRDILERISK